MLAPPNSLHVAILDDHRLSRQGISYRLHGLPFVARVSEAATFAELLPQLALRLPHILLLNTQLPDMDGMEVVKRLLADYPELKIIVLARHSGAHVVAHMVELGVRGYLPKDADQEQLRTAIAAVMADDDHFAADISRPMTGGPGTDKPGLPSLQLPPVVLTHREADVLALVCKGCSTNEIAQRLFISNRTVDGHRQNLLKKTNTPNAVALALYAFRHGLCPTSD